MKAALIVPVYKNFEGFAELMESVDIPVLPIVISNWKDNIGVAAAWNKGLKEAVRNGCDAAFIVNDDVVFEPGSMERMAIGLAEGYMLVTAYNVREGRFDEYHRPRYIPHPDYSAFVVDPVRLIHRVGWFDEGFKTAYFEDNDMAYRISLAGFKQGKSIHAPMMHKGSVTQNWGGGQVVTSPMFEKNREYYIWKWGGEPGNETRTEPNTLPQDTEIGVGLE